jgi:hypothetical protein
MVNEIEQVRIGIDHIVDYTSTTHHTDNPFRNYKNYHIPSKSTRLSFPTPNPNQTNAQTNVPSQQEKSDIMDDTLPRRYSDSSTADMQRPVQDCTAGSQKTGLRVQRTPQAADGRRAASPSDERCVTQSSCAVWEEEAKS